MNSFTNETLNALQDFFNGDSLDWQVTSTSTHSFGNVALLENNKTGKSYYILEAAGKDVSEYKVVNTNTAITISVVKANPSIK